MKKFKEFAIRAVFALKVGAGFSLRAVRAVFELCSVKVGAGFSQRAVVSFVVVLFFIFSHNPIFAQTITQESEHFTIKTPEEYKFLIPYALETLEKAYQEIGSDLNTFPKEKVPVEIYETEEKFSKASTLSMEILDRTGVVGICKFKRLMIISPDQLMYGYRWRDTLAHEYTHYLINIASNEKCPLWLHEGIAKYHETRWRLKDPYFLTPGNQTELVRSMKDEKLIPFSRMEPSMVYLKDQNEVRLAFSEVAYAVSFIVKTKSEESLRKILSELSQGHTRDEAIKTAMGLNTQEFESSWRDYLKQQDLKETPGSAPDVIKMGHESNELEEFVGLDLRAYIRLGDRMRQAGRTDTALIEYQKALEKEPNNPVVLTKIAKIMLSHGRADEAKQSLEKSIQENPNYGPPYLLLGTLMIEKQDWPAAQKYLEESNAINPFNPEVHKKLSQVYETQGDKPHAAQETAAYNQVVR